MRVVVAPDKFKGSLTAAEVATAVAEGVRAERPDAEQTLVPVADGGDGTVDAAVGTGFSRIEVDAVGPTGRPVRACYAVDGRRAVVELASVVGLERLNGGKLHPLDASTYGLGVVVSAAIEAGAKQVILGLGGSASTDGGAGLAQALGARLLDERGTELGRGGKVLQGVASVDMSELRARCAGVEFTVASDVDNPLLGAKGAASIFGPQKGATPEQVSILESALSRWSEVVRAASGRDLAASPGAGAAGGTAFAAMALLDADLVPGIDLMLDLVGLPAVVAGSALVITGEGSLDEQSLAGKAPVGVARTVRDADPRVPVVAVVGRLALSGEQLISAGIQRAYPLSDLEPDLARSTANAAPLVSQISRRVAAEWLP